MNEKKIIDEEVDIKIINNINNKEYNFLENKKIFNFNENINISYNDIMKYIDKGIIIELEKIKLFLEKSDNCNYEDLTAYELWENVYNKISRVLRDIKYK